MKYAEKTGLKAVQDYAPFGMLLVGRNWGSEEYRFGFNDKENTDGIYGNDAVVDFGDRFYDPRLGKWFSIDLATNKYPQLSPYAFVNNNPIIYKDINGRDFIVVIDDINKTITIKATYYTETDAETQRAQSSATTFNNLSGEFVFIDQNGTEYTINYQLNVVQTLPVGTSGVTTGQSLLVFGKRQGYTMNLEEEAIKRRDLDKSGGANAYYEDEAVYYRDAAWGMTLAGDEIRLASRDLMRKNGKNPWAIEIHEMLHNLGSSHKLIGKYSYNLSSKIAGVSLKLAGINVFNAKDKNIQPGQGTPHTKLFRGDVEITSDSKSSAKVVKSDKRMDLEVTGGTSLSGTVQKKNK